MFKLGTLPLALGSPLALDTGPSQSVEAAKPSRLATSSMTWSWCCRKGGPGTPQRREEYMPGLTSLGFDWLSTQIA